MVTYLPEDQSILRVLGVILCMFLDLGSAASEHVTGDFRRLCIWSYV